MGRVTHEMTNWKGPKTWVLTSNRNWKRDGVGVIHDLDDMHLHMEGPVYILGGQSLFLQLEACIDEIHMYVVNNREASDEWINMNMKHWKPFDYANQQIWSYANLKRKHMADPIDYMTEELFE